MTKNQKNNNITYNDISEIVEYLVKVKSSNYTFDCFAIDDIGQEIRLICFKALSHFDVSKVAKEKWVNFFGRCIDNGLKNLKRDNYARFVPPCNGDCQLLHGDEYLNNELGTVCKKWARFKRNLKRKLSIRNPVNIDNVQEKDIECDSFESNMEAADLFLYLMNNLDDELKEKLILIVNGKKKMVSKQDRKKIDEALKGVLDTNEDGEYIIE